MTRRLRCRTASPPCTSSATSSTTGTLAGLARVGRVSQLTSHYALCLSARACLPHVPALQAAALSFLRHLHATHGAPLAPLVAQLVALWQNDRVFDAAFLTQLPTAVRAAGPLVPVTARQTVLQAFQPVPPPGRARGPVSLSPNSAVRRVTNPSAPLVAAPAAATAAVTAATATAAAAAAPSLATPAAAARPFPAASAPYHELPAGCMVPLIPVRAPLASPIAIAIFAAC